MCRPSKRPSMQVVAAALLSSILLAGLPSSGVAGQTEPSTLQQAPTAKKQPSPLAIASVVMEEAKLDNVEVFAWGKPSQKDVRTIREALEKEIAPFAQKSPDTQDNPLKIWVVIRRYLVATSNDASSSLASVAWCAAYDAEHIVFHEEFYAAKHREMRFTKGPVNKAIALRIAASARQLASIEEGADFQPVAVRDTYLKYSEAEKHAGTVTTRAPAGWVHSDGYAYRYSRGYSAVSGGWEWAQHPDRINWKEYISRAPAGGK
jgi:hypothetical protein